MPICTHSVLRESDSSNARFSLRGHLTAIPVTVGRSTGWANWRNEQVFMSRWIQSQLRAMQAKANSTGGRAQLRRLSRTEYINTVRDLLKVTFVEGNTPREVLPPDGTICGFDKLSKALLLDPSLIENYFRAAQLVVDRAARVKPPRAPRMKHRDEFEKRRVDKSRNIVLTKTGVLLYEGGLRTGPTTLRHPFGTIVYPYDNKQFPVSGKYAIRVRAGPDRAGRPDEAVFMDMTWSRGKQKRFEVQATIAKPAVYEWILDVDINETGELNVRMVNGSRFYAGFRDSFAVRSRIDAAVKENDQLKADRERARGRAQGLYAGNVRDAPTPERWTCQSCRVCSLTTWNLRDQSKKPFRQPTRDTSSMTGLMIPASTSVNTRVPSLRDCCQMRSAVT